MVDNENIDVVDNNEGYKKPQNTKHKSYFTSIRETLFSSLNGFLVVASIIIYIIVGLTANCWKNAWIIFFIPDIICSTVRAIKHKRLTEVNIIFICCFIYFFVCMVYPGYVGSKEYWHPMWVIFLLIPAWYIFFGKVDHNYHKDDYKN